MSLCAKDNDDFEQCGLEQGHEGDCEDYDPECTTCGGEGSTFRDVWRNGGHDTVEVPCPACSPEAPEADDGGDDAFPDPEDFAL